MLVLSRKLGEKIYISDNIIVTIVDIRRGAVRLGIDAPHGVVVLREELVGKHGDSQSRPLAQADRAPVPTV